jgi:hypothetical protein
MISKIKQWISSLPLVSKIIIGLVVFSLLALVVLLVFLVIDLCNPNYLPFDFSFSSGIAASLVGIITALFTLGSLYRGKVEKDSDVTRANNQRTLLAKERTIKVFYELCGISPIFSFDFLRRYLNLYKEYQKEDKDKDPMMVAFKTVVVVALSTPDFLTNDEKRDMRKYLSSFPKVPNPSFFVMSGCRKSVYCLRSAYQYLEGVAIQFYLNDFDRELACRLWYESLIYTNNEAAMKILRIDLSKYTNFQQMMHELELWYTSQREEASYEQSRK